MFVPSWLSQLRRRLIPRQSSKVRRASSQRRVRLRLEPLEDRVVPTADSVQVVANNLSTPFSTSQQTLSLSAKVSDTTTPGTTVTEGTVTFIVKDASNTQIGTSVPGTVDSTGKATASFQLPSEEPAGNYTIDVSYADSADPANFTDGGNDQAGALTVNPATVKVVGGNTSASFSTSGQSVTVTATVTDDSFPSDTVNEGKVTFTLKNSSGTIVTASAPGTVDSTGKASATLTLPGNEPPGTYTVAVAYLDSASPANFSDDGTDTAGTLSVGAAATTTQATSTTANFSSNAQSVTLTANVTSGGGTVNEGNVLFTIVDGNGNTIGTSASGSVTNGSSSVSYTLPGGTAAGSYTIDADYIDLAGTFSSSLDTSQTLTVAAVNATSLSLTSVSIKPNLLNGTAQVTLTAQVSNPGGTVNEGVLSFTVAGVSGQANVSNGTATVQLSVPIQNVFNGFTVGLSYTDNASANFANGSSSEAVSTSILDALFSANLTFNSSGDESLQFTMGNLPLFSASYSSSTGLLSQIGFGSLSMPVTYSNIGNTQVATVDGVTWGIIFRDNAGNFLGIADVEPGPDGSLVFVVHDANHNVIGEFPYGS